MITLLLLALAQGDLAFTRGETLAEGRMAWVGFARDGKSYLLMRRATPPAAPLEFALFLGQPGAVELRKLHQTIVTWDDILMGQITADAFSCDGSRLAFPGSVPEEGKKTRLPRVFLSTREGEVETLTPEKAQAWFPAWSPTRDELYFIEMQDYRGMKPGYAIRRYRPGTKSAETLYENADQLPLHLRPSPDGNRLAFLSSMPVREGGEVRLRILTLVDKAIVDSEPFFLDDYFADACPPIHWHPEGKGVWFYRSPDAKKPAGPERYQPAFFDLEKRKSEPLAEDYSMMITAVLDAGHLLIVAGTARRGEYRSGVLRLADKKRFLLPEGMMGIAGVGRTVAVLDGKSTALGTIEIPK